MWAPPANSAGTAPLIKGYELSPGAAASNLGYDASALKVTPIGASSATPLSSIESIHVNAKSFGSICDGSSHPLSATYATLSAAQVVYPSATSLTQETDNVAIQTAWNYANTRNADVYIGGGSGECKGINLTMPTPVGSNKGNRSALYGDSEGATVLRIISGTTSANCGINIAADLGVTSNLNETFRNFQVRGPDDNVGHGYGVCVNSTSRLSFSHVWFDSLDTGLNTKNSNYITMDHPTFNVMGNFGINAQCGTSDSSPSHGITCSDGWLLIWPRVVFNAGYGLSFNNAADIDIYGGDFENNQLGGVQKPVIKMNGAAADGTKGLSLYGGYFTNNCGSAEIEIKPYAGAGFGSPSQNGVHTIDGAEFQRSTNVPSTCPHSNSILLSNVGSTGTTTVNIRGNGFQGFNGYVPDVSRPYVGIASSSTANFVIKGDGNWFADAVESPVGSSWWNAPSHVGLLTLGVSTGAAAGITAGPSALLGLGANDTPSMWLISGSGRLYPNNDGNYNLGGSANRILGGYFANTYVGNANADKVTATGAVPFPTGSCSINTQVGGNASGSFKLNGACAAGTVIFAFTSAAPNDWICSATDATTPATTIAQNNTTASTTSATLKFNATGATGDLIRFSCTAY